MPECDILKGIEILLREIYMLTVFLKIAAIFAMTAIGFTASKTGVLPAESKKYLSNLLLFITSPCMIIGSMTSQTLDAHTFELMIQIVAGSFIFFLAAMAVSFLIVKLMRCDREDAGVLMVIITAVNTGFMGFPVTKAIFGNTYFFLMVIQNIVLNIYIYSMMVYQMNYGFRKKEGIKGMLMPMLNMCTYALIIGLVLMLLKVQLPDILDDFINTIGDATIPVSMIVVGVQLSESSIGKMLTNKRLITASLCNVILIPALTFLAVNWLPLAPESKLILIFAAAFPCAVVSTAIALKENRNAALMAEGVAMTTLLSMGTLPVAAILLM